MSLVGRLARFGPRDARSCQQSGANTSLTDTRCSTCLSPPSRVPEAASAASTAPERHGDSGCQTDALRDHEAILSPRHAAKPSFSPLAIQTPEDLSLCPICGLTLKLLDSPAKAHHVNQCLDVGEAPEKTEPQPHASALEAAPSGAKASSGVEAWLQAIGLQRHWKRFREEDVDLSCLPMLSMADLSSLGLNCPAERKTFLRAVQQRTSQPAAAASTRSEAPEGTADLLQGFYGPTGEEADRQGQAVEPSGTQDGSDARQYQPKPARKRPQNASKPRLKKRALEGPKQDASLGQKQQQQSGVMQQQPAKRRRMSAAKIPVESHDSSYDRTLEAALLVSVFEDDTAGSDLWANPESWHGPLLPNAPFVSRQPLDAAAARLVPRSRSLWACAALVGSERPPHVPLAERIHAGKTAREAAKREARLALERERQAIACSEAAALRAAESGGAEGAAEGAAPLSAAQAMQLRALRAELKAAEQTVADLKGLIADLERTEAPSA